MISENMLAFRELKGSFVDSLGSLDTKIIVTNDTSYTSSALTFNRESRRENKTAFPLEISAKFKKKNTKRKESAYFFRSQASLRHRCSVVTAMLPLKRPSCWIGHHAKPAFGELWHPQPNGYCSAPGGLNPLLRARLWYDLYQCDYL